MNDNKPASIETIFDFLFEFEPMEKCDVKPLEVFRFDDKPVYLNADVNIEDKYGCIFEWWLSSETDDYIDGGFEPACNEAEVMQLAALIHGACLAVIKNRG